MNNLGYALSYIIKPGVLVYFCGFSDDKKTMFCSYFSDDITIFPTRDNALSVQDEIKELFDLDFYIEVF